MGRNSQSEDSGGQTNTMRPTGAADYCRLHQSQWGTEIVDDLYNCESTFYYPIPVNKEVVADYKDSLTEKILAVGRELDALNLRMQNPNYVERAPAHLVLETKQQIEEKEQLISRLKTQLALI